MSVTAVVTGSPGPQTFRELRWFIGQDRAEHRRRGQPHLRGLNLVSVSVFRVGQYTARSRSLLARALTIPWAVVDLVYFRLLLGAEFSRKVNCGPGLVLWNAGFSSGIADGCTLGSRVLLAGIGLGGGHPRPVVSDDVRLLPGAMIMGSSIIGPGATLGPQALLKNGQVAAGASAEGRPAKTVTGSRPGWAKTHRSSN